MSLPRSARLIQDAARERGLAALVVEMPASTRTAEEAARACGCAVGQIVKSLVFRGSESGHPYLLLVSGANRVDERKVATDLGEKLVRPDAQYVRDVTGFAIGGIPPFGHAEPLRTFMDRDLLSFTEVWAAAGTPHCVMALSPEALCAAVGATVISVT